MCTPKPHTRRCDGTLKKWFFLFYLHAASQLVCYLMRYCKFYVTTCLTCHKPTQCDTAWCDPAAHNNTIQDNVMQGGTAQYNPTPRSRIWCLIVSKVEHNPAIGRLTGQTGEKHEGEFFEAKNSQNDIDNEIIYRNKFKDDISFRKKILLWKA